MSETLSYKKRRTTVYKEIYYIITGTLCLRAGSFYMSTYEEDDITLFNSKVAMLDNVVINLGHMTF